MPVRQADKQIGAQLNVERTQTVKRNWRTLDKKATGAGGCRQTRKIRMNKRPFNLGKEINEINEINRFASFRSARLGQDQRIKVGSRAKRPPCQARIQLRHFGDAARRNSAAIRQPLLIRKLLAGTERVVADGGEKSRRIVLRF